MFVRFSDKTVSDVGLKSCTHIYMLAINSLNDYTTLHNEIKCNYHVRVDEKNVLTPS
jgi:hypothetical protein